MEKAAREVHAQLARYPRQGVPRGVGKARGTHHHRRPFRRRTARGLFPLVNNIMKMASKARQNIDKTAAEEPARPRQPVRGSLRTPRTSRRRMVAPRGRSSFRRLDWSHDNGGDHVVALRCMTSARPGLSKITELVEARRLSRRSPASASSPHTRAPARNLWLRTPGR